MDSTNFQQHEQQQQYQQQHHLQDHFVGCSPLNNNPLPVGGSFSVSNSLDWNPNILSTTRTTSNIFCNKLYEEDPIASSSLSNSISPILKNDGRNFEYQSPNNNFPKSEEDMLSSFPTFGGLINNPTNNIMENSCSFNGLSSGLNNNNNVTNKDFMHQFTLGQQKNDQHHSSSLSYTNMPINNWINGLGFPSTNNVLHQLGLLASSPNHSATSASSSIPRLGLNMQAMDLLGNNANFGSHVLHEEVISPVGKIVPSKAIAAGTKRSSSSSDQAKATTSNNGVTSKKSHLKVSCPPFKVRKEKLGDRIASLHQMVSPFGKTDTASVLTEAIGYIQFLQDQIHTLCMPHAKPSRNNKLCKPFQMGAGINQDDDENDEESRVDIRRRGLCLVPVSWTSYITPNHVDASCFDHNHMDASNTSYF